MNTNFTSKIAAATLGIATVAAIATTLSLPLSAQVPVMTASVPVDFVAGKKSAPAGNYKIVIKAPGLVAISTEGGKGLSMNLIPVQTAANSNRASLSFDRNDSGEYLLSGYCHPGSGCWVTTAKSASKNGNLQRIEVALK
jgi:hypothetical protein